MEEEGFLGGEEGGVVVLGVPGEGEVLEGFEGCEEVEVAGG